MTIGLQPTLANEIQNADVIRALFDTNTLSDKIKAIGEVGLDYHWVKGDKERGKQERLFIDCINLANERNIPLVIHSRKAESRVLDVLEKYAEVPVLLHSFEGNLKIILRAKELEYKISVPTNVVIRKNRRKVAIRAGIDNILLETDSPYCSPSEDLWPNTPETIPIAAKKLSQILEIDIEEVARVTSKNSKEFFKI